jgi:DNA end-binding protein Ku
MSASGLESAPRQPKGSETMAPRTTWKGHLKLSLVSCPVRLYNAVSRSERVSFHLLHKDTHNRIQMFPHDPELGKVDRSDLVKGYEYEKDQYVVLTDEDFDKVQIDSSRAIVIEKFVDQKDVDPIYLDSPYYVAPDGPVAEETFRVVHEAMRQKKKVALSRIVLSSRERLIALAVRDRGFVVMTLRAASEVRDDRPYFEDIGEGEPDQEMLELAEALIDKKSGKFDPSEFKDNYQEALLELVKAKIKGQEPVVAKAPERGKVVNLMDALKRSLDEGEARKPPAKSRERKAAAEKQPASRGGAKKKQAKAS